MCQHNEESELQAPVCVAGYGTDYSHHCQSVFLFYSPINERHDI